MLTCVSYRDSPENLSEDMLKEGDNTLSIYKSKSIEKNMENSPLSKDRTRKSSEPENPNDGLKKLKGFKSLYTKRDRSMTTSKDPKRRLRSGCMNHNYYINPIKAKIDEEASQEGPQRSLTPNSYKNISNISLKEDISRLLKASAQKRKESNTDSLGKGQTEFGCFRETFEKTTNSPVKIPQEINKHQRPCIVTMNDVEPAEC